MWSKIFVLLLTVLFIVITYIKGGSVPSLIIFCLIGLNILFVGTRKMDFFEQKLVAFFLALTKMQL